MKVIFCTFDTSNYINGPNAWLRRLLPELQTLGIQSKVLFVPVAPEWECTTIPLLRQEGFECLVIPEPHYTEYRVRWILEKVAEESPDIFVPNFMVPAFYASHWIREAGIPTVGILHSDDDYYCGIMSEFVFGEPNYQLSAIVCVSQLLEQRVLQQQLQRTLVQRIPYGAPLPQLVASKPMEKLRLAYVGRLVQEQKRIIETTSALCRVVREVPNTEVVIYGSGHDEAIVEQIIQREGRGLPVHLAGRVDSQAMQVHLLNCHGLVLLSDYEGLPVAVMEAMACGVVPICLQIESGIPELVEDGVTGLLVRDRGDDFVAAIKRLRQEPGLWEQLSQQARAKIQAEYSHQVCATRWQQFFQELHQAAGPRRLIKVPSQLNLPPVASVFKGHDCRQPSIYHNLLQKSRIFAGGVKRRILSGQSEKDTNLLKL